MTGTVTSVWGRDEVITPCTVCNKDRKREERKLCTQLEAAMATSSTHLVATAGLAVARPMALAGKLQGCRAGEGRLGQRVIAGQLLYLRVRGLIESG